MAARVYWAEHCCCRHGIGFCVEPDHSIRLFYVEMREGLMCTGRRSFRHLGKSPKQ
jgi:hypothetical protein